MSGSVWERKSRADAGAYEGGDVSRALGLVPSRSAKIDVRLIPRV